VDSNNPGGRPRDSFVTSMYWAVATFTSTGYGDVVAASDNSRSFAIVAMLLSMALVAFAQAMATSLLTKRDPVTDQMDERKRTMHAMLSLYDVPWSLQAEVLQSFPFALEAQREEKFRKMIDDLPPAVGAKMSLHFRARGLTALQPFAPVVRALESDRGALQRWQRRVANSIVVRHLMPQDWLVSEGDPCLEMYVVVRGEAEVIARGTSMNPRAPRKSHFDASGAFELDEEVIATLRPGMTAGSVALAPDDDEDDAAVALSASSEKSAREAATGTPRSRRLPGNATRMKRDEPVAAELPLLPDSRLVWTACAVALLAHFLSTVVSALSGTASTLVAATSPPSSPSPPTASSSADDTTAHHCQRQQ